MSLSACVDRKDSILKNYFDSVASQWDKNPLEIERAEVTARKIKDINFNSYASIVDFGSGTGLLGVQLRDLFGKVHLIDSSNEMLKLAQAKIAEAKLCNIETHYADRLADLTSNYSAIATLMTLHHVVDINQFFADSYKILNDAGVLIIADLFAEDGSFHKQLPAFNGHNGFDLSVLSEMAEKNGFIVQSVERYYEIWQENFEGQEVAYPLFFFVAKKCS